MSRALRFQGNLPLSFWGDCVLAASYIISHTPASLLDNKTPYEILFNISPSYDTFRGFGCLCYAFNIKSKRDKFMSRSRKCIFVGYPRGKKGWKLYDLEIGEYFVLRDVKFNETEFHFARNTPSTSSSPKNIFASIFDYTNDSFDDLLYIGGSGSGNNIDGGVVEDSVVITVSTSRDGVMSTSNDDVGTRSAVGHEMGSSEVQANASYNNQVLVQIVP